MKKQRQGETFSPEADGQGTVMPLQLGRGQRPAAPPGNFPFATALRSMKVEKKGGRP